MIACIPSRKILSARIYLYLEYDPPNWNDVIFVVDLVFMFFLTSMSCMTVWLSMFYSLFQHYESYLVVSYSANLHDY